MGNIAVKATAVEDFVRGNPAVGKRGDIGLNRRRKNSVVGEIRNPNFAVEEGRNSWWEISHTKSL